MKKIILLSTLFCIMFFSACFEEKKYENDVYGNFEALWQTLDQKYCYFELKEINWDSIHSDYYNRLNPSMSSKSFFYLMKDMLANLKDGHVNLSSPFDVASYKDWYFGYPRNFYYDVIEDYYLGENVKTSSGLKYQILNDNIGYVYYSSFSNPLGEGNLNEVIKEFITCDGIIIDVRDNGGGELTNSDKLTSAFVTEKTHVGYIQHKTGPSHNDFSKPYSTYIKPYKGVSFLKKVAILTNRRCYSSTNDFVNAMTYIPTVKIFGDKTGGGAGLPMSSELPNGWGVRYSASPMLNADKQHIELGIEPDVYVSMTEEDRAKGIDPIIEAARTWISE